MVISPMPQEREEGHPRDPNTFQSAYIELERRYPPPRVLSSTAIRASRPAAQTEVM
jgi:hypothetical protein